MNKLRPATRLTATLVILLFAVSCIRPWGPGGVKRELSREAGVKLDQELGITVTRSGIWLARQILKWTDEGDEIPELKGLRRVEVGIYNVEDYRRGHDEMVALDAGTFGPDWTPLVRVVEDNETVQVMTKERDGELRGMLVVVAEEDEWVIVRMRGRLDRIVESAMEFAFDQADRPELGERTVEVWEERKQADTTASVEVY